jgi:hypothetical protein
MHAFALLLGNMMTHDWAKDLLVKAQKIVVYINSSHKPRALFLEALKQRQGQQVGLQTSNGTRLTSSQLCESSVLKNESTFQTMLEIPGALEAFTSAAVVALLQDRQFFMDLEKLDAVLSPIAWVIMAVQRKDTSLADITR